MSRFTEQEFLEMQHKMQRTDRPSPEHFIDAASVLEPESALANSIKQWADAKGYPCLVHPRSKKLSWFLPPGYADIVLSLPLGITLYLETKAQKGIWRKEQQLMAMQWKQLGHFYFVVKSFKQFLEIIQKVQMSK